MFFGSLFFSQLNHARPNIILDSLNAFSMSITSTIGVVLATLGLKNASFNLDLALEILK